MKFKTRFGHDITIKYDQECGEYIATCEDFPGLSVFGDNILDVYHDALMVLKIFLDIIEEDKNNGKSDIIH